jgi:hypothetical protein
MFSFAAIIQALLSRKKFKKQKLETTNRTPKFDNCTISSAPRSASQNNAVDNIMSNPMHPLNPLSPISIYTDTTSGNPSHWGCSSDHSSSSSSSYDSGSSSCDSGSSSSGSSD